MRRPCFIEEDVGLASIADEEAGFSGSAQTHHHNQYNFFSKSMRRGGSYRSLSSLSSSTSSSTSSSPRSARFFEDNNYQQPHFLESCFLCKKPLGNNRDIFMYRGDTPFCSEECRQEQIDIDEMKEKKNWSLSSSMKALRKDQQQNSKSTPDKSQNYHARTSPVAAA
ncbi:hypothetical protein Syun_018745 [Stephania yunnanensis]|uniref:FLZ-type domain-containing protein n=1 Tax=Stephania yunnanensis TaxID=152371 RepID=A0AAP0IUD4_9MAGN